MSHLKKNSSACRCMQMFCITTETVHWNLEKMQYLSFFSVDKSKKRNLNVGGFFCLLWAIWRNINTVSLVNRFFCAVFPFNQWKLTFWINQFLYIWLKSCFSRIVHKFRIYKKQSDLIFSLNIVTNLKSDSNNILSDWVKEICEFEEFHSKMLNIYL